MLKQCEIYNNTAKEARHSKVLQQKKSMFERPSQRYSENSSEKSGCSKQDHSGKYMYGHSNQYLDSNKYKASKLTKPHKKWVINLSSTPDFYTRGTIS